MKQVRLVEVQWCANGKVLGSDIGQRLFRDEDGCYFVQVNQDRLHPVRGVQTEQAVKAGVVKIEWR